MITVTLPSKKDLEELEALYGATKESQTLRELLESLPTAMQAVLDRIPKMHTPIDNIDQMKAAFDELDSHVVDQTGRMVDKIKAIPIDLVTITKLTDQDEYDE